MLVSLVVGLLKNIYFLVFLTTFVPWVELRGSIPLGICLGGNSLLVFTIALLTNFFLAAILLLVLKFLFDFLKRFHLFSKYLKKREKFAKKIEPYGLVGLFVFVSLPLPGSGAYSGVILLKLLGFNEKKGFLAICLGLLTAGILVLLLTKRIC